MDFVRRVSVVGTSGSGKTCLAQRIAGALGAPYVELDALHHLAGWQPIRVDRTQDERGSEHVWVDGAEFCSVAEQQDPAIRGR